MAEYFTFALMAFTSYFTIINPLGTMPVFMTMTGDLSNEERKNTAKKAVIVAFFTMVGFAILGELLFNFFGISINALRMVGGILFFFMGQDMLNARLAKSKIQKDEIKKYVSDISVTPLAIPMICGPGAITNSILLWDQATSWQMRGVLFAIMAFMMLLTFVIFWSATKIMKFLGETGNKVMMRLMGLIVMVIAIELFFSGLRPILRDILMIG
jgi:multiple antibiotic resistance protein